MIAIAAIGATIPVFVSQRDTYSKAGYDWTTVAGIVAASTVPSDGVYFGEDPPTRTIAASFPSVFSGRVDIALAETPANEGSLDGSSVPFSPGVLAAAPDRVVAIWSRRSQSLAAELAGFPAAGYRSSLEWEGPQTVVVVWWR